MANTQPTLDSFVDELPDYVENIGRYDIFPIGSYRRWAHFPKYEHRTEYVYIVCGANNEVIYVGRTWNLNARIQTHIRKPWWSDRNTVLALRIHGSSVEEAMSRNVDIERMAIESLVPSGNIANGGTWRGGRYESYKHMDGVLCG